MPPTSLVGRERELSTIHELLSSSLARLVTLIGEGGVGKTRLALEAGAAAASDFPNGVWFVDLAPVMDPTLVATAVADALDVSVAAGMDVATAIDRVVGERRILLILDNFEHVLPSAPFVARLLAVNPGVHVLVTSRVPLGVRGERQLPVPPLCLPRSGGLVPVDEVAGSEAVRLFAERARDVRPDFSLDDSNAPFIAAICRRLDGIPLALELAAARVKVVPPSALLARLERRLPLLTGGAPDLPERHQTLRATIAWSHDLLTPDERVLFRRLAVFAGGWTLDAAEYVANPDGEFDVFETVASLVNQNMARTSDGQEMYPRYLMLETIREFAVEQLQGSGEAEDVRQRHADYLLALARVGAANLADTPGGDWLSRLEDEQANMRAALAWLRDQRMYAAGIRLATALGPFWRLRSAGREGRTWLETFLSSPARGDVSGTELLAALKWAGDLAGLHGDHAAAERWLNESLSLARRLEDERGIAAALSGLASLRVQFGDIAASIPLFEEAADIGRHVGDHRQAVFTLSYLSIVIAHQGDMIRARELARESQAHLRELGDMRSFEADFSMMVEGWLAYLAGDLEEATRWYEEGLSLGRALDANANLATILAGLGEVAMVRGWVHRAVEHYREGLAIGRDVGFPLGIVFNLQGLARVASRRGRPQFAAQLVGLVDSFGGTIDALPGSGRVEYQAMIERVREVLGQERFVAEHTRGQRLPLDEVVGQASDL